MIRKQGGLFKVLSESGKHMGTYKTEEEAKKRLQQMEMWKHLKSKGYVKG